MVARGVILPASTDPRGLPNGLELSRSADAGKTPSFYDRTTGEAQ